MKKILASVLLISIFMANLFAKGKVEELLKDKDISFNVVNEKGLVVCSIRVNKLDVSCNYGTDYVYLESYKNEIVDENLVVYYANSVFNVNGEPSFRNYDYPDYYKITITKKSDRKKN